MVKSLNLVRGSKQALFLAFGNCSLPFCRYCENPPRQVNDLWSSRLYSTNKVTFVLLFLHFLFTNNSLLIDKNRQCVAFVEFFLVKYIGLNTKPSVKANKRSENWIQGTLYQCYVNYNCFLLSQTYDLLKHSSTKQMCFVLDLQLFTRI